MRKANVGIGIRRALIAGVVAPVALIGALPILLLGLPFWLVGGLTRGAAALFRRLEPRAVPWQELMAFEPELGWRTRPDLDVFARHDVTFHMTTDAEGWRDRRASLDEAEVVVVGDSFAFGTGVDDRDFFGARASVPVKAVGADAYNMVQGLLLMERLGERLRGKVLVWLIYYGNDLYENLRPNHGQYRMPFVRQAPDGDREWEVVSRHVRSDPWPVDTPRRYLQRLAELCTPGPLSRRVFGASRYLIERAAAVSEAVGARLVVVGIPDKLQLTADGARELTRRLPRPAPLDPEAPDRALAAICKDLDVRFISLRQHVTAGDYKADDCHWTAHGHARVARVLVEVHRTCHPVDVDRPRGAAMVSASGVGPTFRRVAGSGRGR
jgi:hypothetical protein